MPSDGCLGGDEARNAGAFRSHFERWDAIKGGGANSKKGLYVLKVVTF